MKIGVFDSGVGGKIVASEVAKSFPDAEVILREDKQNLPYGTKSKSELLNLVIPILNEMAEKGCEVIVIACNTVTTNIISELRQQISVPLVGIEPMIKPAANLTKSGIITVCATPATLKSERYAWLKSEYAKGNTVLEPDCSDWAKLIEENDVNEAEIKKVVDETIDQNADVIVLGCTHYHWIFELIDKLSGEDITVLQPTDAVISQLKKVISQPR